MWSGEIQSQSLRCIFWDFISLCCCYWLHLLELAHERKMSNSPELMSLASLTVRVYYFVLLWSWPRCCWTTSAYGFRVLDQEKNFVDGGLVWHGLGWAGLESRQEWVEQDKSLRMWYTSRYTCFSIAKKWISWNEDTTGVTCLSDLTHICWRTIFGGRDQKLEKGVRSGQSGRW